MDLSAKRVDLTLKSGLKAGSSNSSFADFGNFHVGDVISGRIRRIEPYGLFITVNNSNMVIWHTLSIFVCTVQIQIFF